MATTDTPNDEMTAAMKKEDPAAPTNGIAPEATTGTEQPQLEAGAAAIAQQHVVAHATSHVPAPEVPTDVDTSAMIAEAGK